MSLIGSHFAKSITSTSFQTHPSGVSINVGKMANSFRRHLCHVNKNGKKSTTLTTLFQIGAIPLEVHSTTQPASMRNLLHSFSTQQNHFKFHQSLFSIGTQHEAITAVIRDSNPSGDARWRSGESCSVLNLGQSRRGNRQRPQNYIISRRASTSHCSCCKLKQS